MDQAASAAERFGITIECDNTVPLRIDELAQEVNAAWITKAFAETYPGILVETAQIVKGSVSTSIKLWLDLSFNDVGKTAKLPTRVVVKGGFNRLPHMQYTYDNEMESYRQIVGTAPINSPKCYYAGVGPDGHSSTIIIEDLTARNVRFLNPFTPLGLDEIKRFLDAHARLHAANWNRPDMLDGSAPFAKFSNGLLGLYREYYAEMTGVENWKKYTAMPRGAAVPMKFIDRDRILKAFSNLSKFGETQDKTIVMGDEHLGNLFIEADGSPGFLDFQCKFTPWCRAIAYCLVACLDTPDRMSWERDLIAYYIERLQSYGITPPDFETAYDAYCRYLLHPFMIWIINDGDMQPEAIDTVYTARAAAAMLHNDTLGRLGA